MATYVKAVFKTMLSQLCTIIKNRNIGLICLKMLDVVVYANYLQIHDCFQSLPRDTEHRH